MDAVQDRPVVELGSVHAAVPQAGEPTIEGPQDGILEVVDDLPMLALQDVGRIPLSDLVDHTKLEDEAGLVVVPPTMQKDEAGQYHDDRIAFLR